MLEFYVDEQRSAVIQDFLKSNSKGFEVKVGMHQGSGLNAIITA